MIARTANPWETLTASQKVVIKAMWLSKRHNTAQIAADIRVRAPEHVVANFIYDWREQRRAARAAA